MSPRPPRGPTVPLLLRVPPDLRRALRVRAAELGFSMAVVAERILIGRERPLRVERRSTHRRTP